MNRLTCLCDDEKCSVNEAVLVVAGSKPEDDEAALPRVNRLLNAIRVGPRKPELFGKSTHEDDDKDAGDTDKDEDDDLDADADNAVIDVPLGVSCFKPEVQSVGSGQ